MLDAEARAELLRLAIGQIAARCPRLIAQCYWAGTSAIALEELGHRESFDLDFHTRDALLDTRPLLGELQKAFPGALELIRAPDAFGSGFTGVIELKTGVKLTVQVFAAFEDVPHADLVASATEPRLLRVSLRRYLVDKVQCLVERIEGRDLVDIAAVLEQHPELDGVLRRAVRSQDLLLLAERLIAWSDESLREDLRAHSDVKPETAIAMRDRLLALLRLEGSR